jgi:hypothetical protein
MFGLSNSEGNHGEDCKELYYYLDNTPTHSYMRMLYKYPQAEFPYEKLVQENKQRNKTEPEYELLDTGSSNIISISICMSNTPRTTVQIL